MTPFRTTVIPSIDYDRCQACPKCVAAQHCRFRALVRIDRDEPPYVDVSMCGGCGECFPHCPHEAVVPPRTGAARAGDRDRA